MTTEEYLSQLKHIDRKINDKLAEANRWRDVAMATGGAGNSPDRVQTTKRYDKMGDAISMAADYEAECMKMAKDLAILKYNITKQIDDMPCNIHYVILKSLYLHGKSINETLVEVGYSRAHFYRLMNAAMKEFEDLYGYCYLQKKRKR